MTVPRITLLLAAATPVSLSASAESNPFPDPISVGDIAVPIRDYARVARGSRLNLLAPDPTGRLFAVAQQGELFRIEPGDAPSPVYFDIREQPGVQLQREGGDEGFQSFAFHPEFATAGAAGFGRFYTAHSESNNARTADFLPRSVPAPSDEFVPFDTVLTEWSTPDPFAGTFAGTSREVMRIKQPVRSHNGGQQAFNTNARAGAADFGQLYFSLGDGGVGGDPQELAQDLGFVHGSILRIDPLGRDAANGRYGIPADNPFAADDDGALDEIWAYGFRNPQRIGFDPANGNLFVADIGETRVEEIDLAVAGGNYGWNAREGSLPHNGGADSADFIDPIAEYDHTDSFALPGNGNFRAITVGTVVRNASLPGLDGRLLLGDFPSGYVFTLDADGELPDGGQDPLTELLFLNEAGETKRLIDLINDGGSRTTRADLRFGHGIDGEIFVLNKVDGVIRQLVPEPATAGLLLFAGIGALLRRRRG